MPVKNAQTKSPIIRNLTGGLNVREAITDIADNENIASTNLNYYTAGAIARRGGWVKLFTSSPTSSPLLGIYQPVFNVAGVLTTFIVITDGAGIWSSSNNGSSWSSILGGATLDSTQPYHFIMMTNKLIIYNGKVAYYWTGSGNITAFSLPSGTFYSLSVGDIVMTAVASGVSTVTYIYTSGATAGAEVVSVVGNAISVQIANGVSTATQIIAKIQASAPATALIGVTTQNGAAAQTVSLAPTATALVAPYITVPLSRIAVVWQNFLFWAGDATNPNRLYFSTLADPTTYPQANFIDVPDPFSGDQLTGVAILYGNLLVFKRYSFYILQGAPPGNLILSKLNSSVGCVEPSSVVQVDNLVYFVSDKGLYAANLFNIQQKCYKVEPRYISAVPASTSANPIWAAHYKNKAQIFISVNCRPMYNPNSNLAYNDRILVHDYFNADQNGDPACSEFIVGYTSAGLAAVKPNFPTAPSIMGDYAYTASSQKSVTIMASFYDQYIYVFTDGTLAVGGPQDNISWLSSAQYPPTDYLSKFFDMGDPDMIKQVRWLWTTAQIYNTINLGAGIVYNNSPTTASFVDFNTDTIELQSANGNSWLLGIDDDGAINPVLTSDTTYLTTLKLADSNGVVWAIGMDNDGAITTTLSSGTPNANPILASATGYQYQIGVDVDGAIMTTAAFNPSTSPIVPGQRVVVSPVVNGVTGSKSGKYFQLYFTGIGILSQYSMDVILKGRRN